jgi:hypothetical protein
MKKYSEGILCTHCGWNREAHKFGTGVREEDNKVKKGRKISLYECHMIAYQERYEKSKNKNIKK